MNAGVKKPLFYYIDINGNSAFSKKFEGAVDFSEGFAGVRINNKWGYIYKNGEVIIQPVFDSVSNFSE